MLPNNMSFLKNSHPKIYEMINNGANRSKDYTVLRENDNIRIELGKQIKYVHSNFSTDYECECIYNDIPNIESYDQIIFLGVGLGHHINYVADKLKKKDVYLYEPSIDIFREYVNYSEIPTKNLKGICIGESVESINTFLVHITKANNDNILIVELPTYKNFCAKNLDDFYKVFKKVIREKRSNVHTNYSFQKKWIVNGMVNFFDLMKTPNIINENVSIFRRKPVIIAASGPSLTDEIETLKKIKEEGLAYIFAVGSAITILIKNGVYPDATMSYDPGPTQHLNHDILRENNIDTIPLIFGSTVGNKTVRNYPGPKLHMVTTQDSTASHYFDIQDTHKISDAPSIAAIALQVVTKLQCNPIIFTGQNLAYRDKKWYAEGQRKGYEKLDEENVNKKSIVEVKDVYGNKVHSTAKLIQFKNALEYIIKRCNGFEFINTTKHGAEIEGTKFIELDKLIEMQLTEKVVDDNWYEKYSNETCDYQKVNDKNIELYNAIVEFQSLIAEDEKILTKIERLIKNNNLKQVEQMYPILDKTHASIEQNVYYKYYILPMNRVHYEKLGMDVRKGKKTSNTTLKGKMIVEGYRSYLNICKAEDIRLRTLMKEFLSHVKKACIEAES